jgi:hypothetical protein
VSFVLKNAHFEYGGTTWTSYVESITFNIEADAPEQTAMGDDWRTYLGGGLLNGTIEVAFNQESSTLDATLYPLMATTAAWAIRGTTAGVSAANPSFTGVGIITNYSPITGTVGDKASAPVSIVCASSVDRATA